MTKLEEKKNKLNFKVLLCKHVTENKGQKLIVKGNGINIDWMHTRTEKLLSQKKFYLYTYTCIYEIYMIVQLPTFKSFRFGVFYENNLNKTYENEQSYIYSVSNCFKFSFKA